MTITIERPILGVYKPEKDEHHVEYKAKGKTTKNKPGPFSVRVIFSDGSSLMVCRNVDDVTASAAYNEHVNGIGAQVGTTKRVCVFDECEHEYGLWVYSGGEIGI